MSRKRVRRPLTLITLLCIVLISACIVVPVRTPTVTQNPTGQKDKLPTLAFVPGKTTRAQVEDQYKTFAVDSGAPNLYWARFRQSKWAVFYAAGGGYNAVGGGGRTWGTYNLLVLFDSDGNVKSSEIRRDKELLDRLQMLCKDQQFPALDLQEPITLKVDLNQRSDIFSSSAWDQARHRGILWIELRLSETEMIVTMHKQDRIVHKQPVPQPPEIVAIPIADVLSVKTNWTESPSTIPVTIRLSQEKRITSIGSKLKFDAAPSELLTLLRWHQQVQAQQPHAQKPEQPSS